MYRLLPRIPTTEGASLVPKAELFVAGPALGAMMLLLPGAGLYARASIALQGTIESSRSSCIEPAHNRCATIYFVRTVRGDVVRYVAGANDQSLRRYLPVGTVIDKEKWRFSYLVNGKLTDGYYFDVYFGAFFAGFLIFAGSYLPEVSEWLSRRRMKRA